MFLTRIRHSAIVARRLRRSGEAAGPALSGVDRCGVPGTFQFKSAVETATRGSPS